MLADKQLIKFVVFQNVIDDGEHIIEDGNGHATMKILSRTSDSINRKLCDLEGEELWSVVKRPEVSMGGFLIVLLLCGLDRRHRFTWCFDHSLSKKRLIDVELQCCTGSNHPHPI